MSIDEIRHVGVVGAGTMGHGIAQVCAVQGYQVTLVDVVPQALERALHNIAASVEKLHSKGKLTDAQRQAALEINTATDIAALRSANLIIEAVSEDAALKRDIFARLDELTPSHAILATNTSSISITAIAAATQRPDRVIGMHFMNPVPLMQLVEIIRGLATSQATLDTFMELARRLGKTPVEAADYPGFIANRILMPMINEAIYALMEGAGTAEAIDTVMKLGANHPMGPLTLADFIGLDVVLSILEVLYSGFGDPKYRPCPLLRKMVAAGHLGRKSGRGFYEYA